MKRSPWRTGLWFVILAGLAMVLVRAFQPQPVLVDLGVVVSGPMQVTVENDGITRVRDSYVVLPTRTQAYVGLSLIVSLIK